MTHDDLTSKLNYCPLTGVFTWKVKPSRQIRLGAIAGTLDSDGYRKIKVCGKVVHSHRLAWFYVFGYMPEKEIDHINRVKDDNRINNLREATRSENAKNKEKSSANKSGYKGVSFQVKAQKWFAHIRISGKNKHLGCFDSPLRASLAYRLASHFYHGEFSPVIEGENHD